MATQNTAIAASDDFFSSFGYADSAVCIAVFMLAKFWLDQVTEYVPDPYLVGDPFSLTCSFANLD